MSPRMCSPRRSDDQRWSVSLGYVSSVTPLAAIREMPLS